MEMIVAFAEDPLYYSVTLLQRCDDVLMRTVPAPRDPFTHVGTRSTSSFRHQNTGRAWENMKDISTENVEKSSKIDEKRNGKYL